MMTLEMTLMMTRHDDTRDDSLNNDNLNDNHNDSHDDSQNDTRTDTSNDTHNMNLLVLSGRCRDGDPKTDNNSMYEAKVTVKKPKGVRDETIAHYYSLIYHN